MSLTPTHLLDVLDEAIADNPGWAPWRIVLHLHVRTIPSLGETGRPVQHHGSTVYGYTRAQCVRMRDAINAAARSDAGL